MDADGSLILFACLLRFVLCDVVCLLGGFVCMIRWVVGCGVHCWFDLYLLGGLRLVLAVVLIVCTYFDVLSVFCLMVELVFIIA